MNKLGRLEFYSETGTEGGYYALLESEHISYEVPKWGVFSGWAVYDAENIFRRGVIEESFREDGSIFDSAKPGDVAYLTIAWEDSIRDISRPSDTILVERWDNEGLLILRNRDRLRIFNKGIGSVVLWDGVVGLDVQDPHDSDSYAPGLMSSHHRPHSLGDVDAETWSSWFFERRWAEVYRDQS